MKETKGVNMNIVYLQVDLRYNDWLMKKLERGMR